MKAKTALSDNLDRLKEIPIDHILQYLSAEGVEVISEEKQAELDKVLKEARAVCYEISQYKVKQHLRIAALAAKRNINKFLGND